MPMNPDPPPNIKVDKAELRDRLDPIAYQVTQEKGTERPYTNKYYKHYEKGVYTCVVCEEDLFDSATKYESGSGWPSFFDVLDEGRVKYRADASGVGGNILRIVANPHLIRTEVCCRNCGAHLGHIFQDGPRPTGKRYCVNSSSLNFRATSPDAENDEADSATSKPEVLKFLATINGCGTDGFCTLKARTESGGEVKKRIEEEAKKSPEKEEVEQSV